MADVAFVAGLLDGYDLRSSVFLSPLPNYTFSIFPLKSFSLSLDSWAGTLLGL